jgi:hypothetical protein
MAVKEVLKRQFKQPEYAFTKYEVKVFMDHVEINVVYVRLIRERSECEPHQFKRKLTFNSKLFLFTVSALQAAKRCDD